MINALIQNGNQTAVLELPSDPFTLQYELSQIGIRSRLRDIPIKDDEDSEIQVKLFADSDIGNSLAVLFKPSHSLEDANLCAHMVENARQELLEELEQHIVHGQYHSPQAVMADIKAMTEELIGVTVSYYCPLKFQMSDAEYGDWYEVDNGYGIANEEAIRELACSCGRLLPYAADAPQYCEHHGVQGGFAVQDIKSSGELRALLSESRHPIFRGTQP